MATKTAVKVATVVKTVPEVGDSIALALKSPDGELVMIQADHKVTAVYDHSFETKSELGNYTIPFEQVEQTENGLVAFLVQGKKRTAKEIKDSWLEICESLEARDEKGTGHQTSNTVFWLFFEVPIGTYGSPAMYYAHPNFPGWFHFPVPYGTSIQAVKEYLQPILRDGFVFYGWST